MSDLEGKYNSLDELAESLEVTGKNIILLYGSNGTGKTRLSVKYKDITKSKNNNQHIGLYYNAYSEDMFYWDNDVNNEDLPIQINVIKTALNAYHSKITKKNVLKKLVPYNINYDFDFVRAKNKGGIANIRFFRIDNRKKRVKDSIPMKISRGEERIFIWCFLLSIFDVESLKDSRKGHFFIDDPVSSLDDHNVFKTAVLLFKLIEQNYKTKKIIITTHHTALFVMLRDWLTRGKKAKPFGKSNFVGLLTYSDGQYSLNSAKGEVFLYHLHIMKILRQTNENELCTYHFVLLRQVLEAVSSFLGDTEFSYVLKQIGCGEEKYPDIINFLSHENIFQLKFQKLRKNERDMLIEICKKLENKYGFKIST